MNILIDLVPDTIFIDGIEYRINTDFRTSILFELMFEEIGLNDEDIIFNALNLYFEEDIPSNLEMAIEAIRWFYGCGKENKAIGKGQGKNNSKKIYSFEHDADYIYSAFLTQYGIDLQDINYLHWWKFRAMFNALNEDLLFSKIMSYRAIKIDNNMTKEEKIHYRQMKKLYKLPDNRTTEEKEDDFYIAISNMM